MQQGPDLFGQVVVTWPEVVDWCARIAGITPDSPRFIPYVRTWCVTEKIARAKLAGDLERFLEENPRPALAHQPGQCSPVAKKSRL